MPQVLRWTAELKVEMSGSRGIPGPDGVKVFDYEEQLTILPRRSCAI